MKEEGKQMQLEQKYKYKMPKITDYDVMMYQSTDPVSISWTKIVE